MKNVKIEDPTHAKLVARAKKEKRLVSSMADLLINAALKAKPAKDK